MKRAKSQSVIRRNDALLMKIKYAIKKNHPLWGYRKVWSYLKSWYAISVNKKRVYRLMKENNLLVTPEIRLEVKRLNLTQKAELTTFKINEILDRLIFFKNNFGSWDRVALKFDIHKRTMLRWLKTKTMSSKSYDKLNKMLKNRGRVDGHGLSALRYSRIKKDTKKEDSEAERKWKEARRKYGKE